MGTVLPSGDLFFGNPALISRHDFTLILFRFVRMMCLDSWRIRFFLCNVKKSPKCHFFPLLCHSVVEKEIKFVSLNTSLCHEDETLRVFSSG